MNLWEYCDNRNEGAGVALIILGICHVAEHHAHLAAFGDRLLRPIRFIVGGTSGLRRRARIIRERAVDAQLIGAGPPHGASNALRARRRAAHAVGGPNPHATEQSPAIIVKRLHNSFVYKQNDLNIGLWQL